MINSPPQRRYNEQKATTKVMPRKAEQSRAERRVMERERNEAASKAALVCSCLPS